MMAPGHGVEVARFFTEWIETRPDFYVAKTLSDLTAPHNDERLAVVFDIEGACAVEQDLAVLDEYAGLGVRTISAAYNLPNRVGGGCLSPDDGLTALGREFVRRAEGAGVLQPHGLQDVARHHRDEHQPRCLLALQSARDVGPSPEHPR